MTSLEAQIQAYQELVRQIADLEDKKRELGLAILQQMSSKTISIGGCTVRGVERLSFRTTLEKARELGATKMEEVLNKETLKKLHESGHAVPGVSCSTFIQVSVQKEKRVAKAITHGN